MVYKFNMGYWGDNCGDLVEELEDFVVNLISQGIIRGSFELWALKLHRSLFLVLAGILFFDTSAISIL